MARRTARDFVDELRDLASGETTETLSDTRLLRYLNQSILAYEAKYLFANNKASEDITTVAGTSAYSLTAEPIQVDDVTDRTNYYHTEPISEYQYKEYTQGNEANSTGTTVYWFLSGDWELTVYPTPAGVYTLRVDYWAHTDLTLSPTVTSPITPIAFDDAILLRAASAALRQAHDYDGAYKMQLSANDAEKFAKRTAGKPSKRPIRPTSVFANDMR